MTTTLTLTLPEGADQFVAAVFTATGEWVHSGHREECEDLAQSIGGLYCWLDHGRAILRHDYTPASPADERRSALRGDIGSPAYLSAVRSPAYLAARAEEDARATRDRAARRVAKLVKKGTAR